MSQRKWVPLYAGLLILLVFLTPIFSTGYSNLKYANTAFEEKDFSNASTYYLRAARILFWRQDLTEKAGISAAQGGDFASAVGLLKSAPELSGEGWEWLCSSHYQMGDVPAVVETCSDGLQVHESAALYRLLSFAYRSQGDRDLEQAALENQIRLDPNDAYAHYRLGLLLTLSAPPQALDKLTNAALLDPETESAVQTLSAALSLASGQTYPSMQKVIIGRALALVNEWELAQAAFEQAIEIDEKNAEAWAWLGEAKQQLGQDGRVELDTALLLDHTSVNVRALRALYWSRQSKYEQVLAEYLLAAEFDPTNPRWQAGIGETYAILGDLVSALAAYQRAVELAPAEPMYWRLLAMFCAEKGVHVDEIGLPAAQQALALSPEDPQSLDALGFSYFSSGRFSNAEQTFLLAIEHAPNYFPAHIHLAMNYLAQGNRAAAFNSLTFVRDSDPSGVYSSAAKQLLEQYFP